LIDEVVIRGLPPTGELEEPRQRLLQEVVLEDKLKLHLDKLKHCNSLEACLIALLHKIQCILHCESENQRSMAYAEQIQTFFNNRILGDDDGPAQWRLPMDDDGKNVGIICLDNNHIWKIISNFDALANVSISDHS
jgi:hypothetical protein